jgi:hypothetical protein
MFFGILRTKKIHNYPITLFSIIQQIMKNDLNHLDYDQNSYQYYLTSSMDRLNCGHPCGHYDQGVSTLVEGVTTFV